MSANADAILSQALELPLHLRGKLVVGLIDSLDGENEDGYEHEWSEELQRRIEEARSNPSCRVPWTQARELILSEDHGD